MRGDRELDLSGMSETTVEVQDFAASGNIIPREVLDQGSGFGQDDRETSTSTEPKVRHRCNAILDRCIDTTDNAIHSTDFFHHANAVALLQEQLPVLLDESEKRERGFARAVNTIDSILMERRPEEISREELECVSEALVRLRTIPIIDDVVLNDVIGALARGGLNVFRELE